MKKVTRDELVEGQKYYLGDIYLPNKKQEGEFIHNKNSTPLFRVSNIRKGNDELLYNGQQGEFGKSTLNTEFFKPRKEEIINASLQRQALKQTLSALPEDIERYTSAFLDGKFLPKKTKKVSKKKGGFKKYRTLSRRYAKKRKNKTNKKSTKKRKYKNRS